MASEDAFKMFHLIQDLEAEHEWVLREIIHRRLENEGWEEYRIDDAEDELFREDAVMENLAGERLKTTRSTL